MQRQQQVQQVKTQQEKRIEQGLKKKKQLQAKALQLGVSAKHLKKLQQKQKWQQQRLIKRKQQRIKQKQRKKIAKAQQRQLQQKNQALKTQHKDQEHSQDSKDELQKQQKNQQHVNSRSRKQDYQQKMVDNLKVVIDMQFYDLMTQKQLNSMVKQLSYCHAINRKMQKPFNYILTSITQQRAKFIDQKYNGNKWGINLLEQSITLAFSVENLVYLTGDAQKQIQQFDQSKIYIIGGIVDHNRLKKITYDFALAHKIQVKRLPLKNIKLKTNVHLAVNHVWEWMLRNYNGQGWDQALQKVMPQRKIVKLNQ